MLYSPVGAPKPVRVQGCFASDSEIEGVTSYIKNHHRSQYNEEVEERIKKITVEGMENNSGGLTDDSGQELDEKIEEAIKIVGEARWGIDIYTGGIHELLELQGVVLVIGDDTFAMARTIGGDVLDSLIDRINHLHCHLVVHELGAKVIIYNLNILLYHWL